MLTIELVPSSCWFSNVRSEVSQEDWDKLRRMAYTQSGRLCEVCGGRGPEWPVECHEVWQYDDHLHRQTLVGLVALCPACHEVKHRGLANVNRRGPDADLHLATVNGWTLEQAQAYVAEQFTLWRERSKHEWTLDLSWLAQHGVTVPERTGDSRRASLPSALTAAAQRGLSADAGGRKHG